MVNNLPANAGDTRDTNSISVVGRYPVIRKPFLITFLQYFCLENCMDRAAWWASLLDQKSQYFCLENSMDRAA